NAKLRSIQMPFCNKVTVSPQVSHIIVSLKHAEAREQLCLCRFLWYQARIARGVNACFLIVFTKIEIHSLDRENTAA
ncbi:hypothetical protein G3K41_004844, partial [Salmonella enterica]|nr:hypothetical protein [Salmonella enterica]